MKMYTPPAFNFSSSHHTLGSEPQNAEVLLDFREVGAAATDRSPSGDTGEGAEEAKGEEANEHDAYTANVYQARAISTIAAACSHEDAWLAYADPDGKEGGPEDVYVSIVAHLQVRTNERLSLRMMLVMVMGSLSPFRSFPLYLLSHSPHKHPTPHSSPSHIHPRASFRLTSF